MNATQLGRVVLNNLAKGRQRLARINADRQQQSALYKRVIAEYVLLDHQDGRSTWGRAGRIARKLRGKLSVRQVQRYLDALAKVS